MAAVQSYSEMPPGEDGGVPISGAVATVSIANPAAEKSAGSYEAMGVEQQNLLNGPSSAPSTKKPSKKSGFCGGCFGNFFADYKWNRLSPEGKIEFLENELMLEDVERNQKALDRFNAASYSNDFECNWKGLEAHVAPALAHCLRECPQDDAKLSAARLLIRTNFECGHLNHLMLSTHAGPALLTLMAGAENPMLRGSACQLLTDWATSDKFCKRLDRAATFQHEVSPAEIGALASSLTCASETVVKAAAGYLFKCTEAASYCKAVKMYDETATKMVPALIKLLDETDAMAKYLAVGALANLTEEGGDAFLEQVVAAGAVEALVKLLRWHRYGYNGAYLCISALAARTLQHLAGLDSCRQQVSASSTAIPWLVLLLMVNRDGDSPCTCRCRVDHCERCAAGALSAFAQDPALRAKIGEAGAVPALLALLPPQEGSRCCTAAGHWDSYLPAAERHHVLTALRTLSVDDNNKPRFGTGGGVTRVVNQMFASFALSNDPYREGGRPCELCRTLSISMLARLSSEASLLPELSTKQTLIYLVGSLRFDDDVGRRDAVVTLTNLCRIDKNKERISEVGGIKALVHQCLNAKDVDLQRAAEQLIMVMGTNPAVRQQIDTAIKAFWESTAKKFAPAGQLKMQM